MEKRQYYITPFELLIILIVRNIRLELDITGEELSKYLKKNPKYIGHIESSNSDSKYTEEVLYQIANYFTLVAEKLKSELPKSETKNFKTSYSNLDLQPSEIQGRDKVLKVIPPIPPGSGSASTLNAVIENTKFFDKARTLEEIVNHCNKLQNQNWTSSDFTDALSRAVKGKNKRLEVVIVDGRNTYIKYKPKKESIDKKVD
ncbi:helix-turn-helix transcriptional regulator [Sphingobacterium sp. JUb56]|uniref:helix-turn-helix domain-containing protein n=1 Tax=Sphingobacterium sp. JUb56 TaxID=2587145 RepID=UPI00161069C9|nr:helix-turn-helix transcriptional regulator [Sphingobacterium sp. JUb56]MBB2951143.1 transcriptional regulator with XRE-family HTH domain [Sphingobacterium sp. JUb56]